MSSKGSLSPSPERGMDAEYVAVDVAVESDAEMEVPMMAKKVKPGTLGKKCVLESNMFVLTPKHTRAFRYDVRITSASGKTTKELSKGCREDFIACDRKDKCRLIMNLLYDTQADFFGHSVGFVYDRAAILFSPKELQIDGKYKTFVVEKGELPQEVDWPNNSQNVTVEISACEESFQIVLDDLSSSIDPNLDKQDRSLRQFYELITSQAAFNNGEHVVFGNGKSFLKNPSKWRMNTKPLGDGKELLSGADKGVRCVEGDDPSIDAVPVVVVDTKKAAFYKAQNICLTVAEMLRIRPEQLSNFRIEPQSREARQLRKALADLYVKTNYGIKKTFPISNLSENSAEKTFIMVDEAQISVKDYYKKKHDIRLKYPKLPCLVHRAGKNQNFYPMELCDICKNQRVPIDKQTPKQMEQMIKECAVGPAQRMSEVVTNMSALQLDKGGANNQWLADWQLKIDSKPLKLNGRQLEGPTANYKGGKIQIDSTRAQWRSEGKAFLRAASCDKWVAIVSANSGDRFNLSDEQIDSFLDVFVERCRSKGMDMSGARSVRNMEPSPGKLDELIKRGQEKHSAKFVLCIQGNGSDLHDHLKLMETKYQITTQDFKMDTIKKIMEKRAMNILDNAIQKTNLKMLGLNFSLDLAGPGGKFLSANDVLIFSYDVSHPPPQSRVEQRLQLPPKNPSIVGMAFNTGANPVEFFGDFHYQEARREKVDQVLYSRMTGIAHRFRDARKCLPKHVIVYRDGVSEGQYKMVMQDEVPQLRRALANVGGEQYAPMLTVVVVQKRHNTRLFPDNVDRVRQNVTPGTVVDTTIVHPNYTEFYLLAHRSPQGTAKAAKCTVLVDDKHMTADELQTLTMGLCYDHQIINQAISLPVPVFMADEWATRGKNVFNAYREAMEAEGKWDSDKPQDFDLLTTRLSYEGKKLADRRVNA